MSKLVVIGSGPGGYACAFRAADLGLDVTLVERYKTLGGVCLNVGCIPSKAYLHAAKVIDDANEMHDVGIAFAKPKIDKDKLKTWKESIVKKLTGGLDALAKKRKVEVIAGEAKFASKNEIIIEQNGKEKRIKFDKAVIAAGSRPVELPFIPKDKRIMDSTGALAMPAIKEKMLVIGGGIIGLEMATVYRALGDDITIVELMEQIIPGADNDIVKPLHKIMTERGTQFLLKTKVTEVKAKKEGLFVKFEGENAPKQAERFDRILVAVGRKPNTDLLDLDKAGIKVNERGFIEVNKQLKTNVDHIYAIGDIIGMPMLAHKATAEGRVAAEIISGEDKRYFEPRCIPSVAYTDPEVAWTGLSENEAKEKNIDYGKGTFPWAASGRALGMNRSEGLTKLLFDNKTHRIIGGAIVGPNAGELIAELSLAIEMGCYVDDIALTIHPHPTLSETVMLAAEMFEGTITDLYAPKKKEGR